MSENGELQFDRADFAEGAPAQACGRCQKPLVRIYYEANGQTVCPTCCTELRWAHQGPLAGALGRSLALGTGAAVLGSLLYYAVGALTGYEFGLIAIVVGFGVGYAVNKGSRGRGGWPFQTMAMVLTYLAIVATTIPAIVEVMTQADTAATATSDGAAAADGAIVEDAEADADEDSAAAADAGTVTEPPAAAAEPTVGNMLFAAAVLVLFACAAPFLAGIENIVGIFIIAIGLYEAWKLNRRAEMVVTGPHRLMPAQAAIPKAS